MSVITINPFALGRLALYDAIQALGLTTGLAEVWDLSDSGAYASGQTITDQSGNGNHVLFGATSGAEASDPTFVGTAGAKVLATHASVDGGDLFRLSITNPASLDNAHKDNAKFVFLLLCEKVVNGSKFTESHSATPTRAHPHPQMSLRGRP